MTGGSALALSPGCPHGPEGAPAGAAPQRGSRPHFHRWGSSIAGNLLPGFTTTGLRHQVSVAKRHQVSVENSNWPRQ